MKISYNWLKELSGADWSVEEMAERLTLSGTACEGIESTARFMDKVIVAKITDMQSVKGADKIRKAVVDTGAEQLDVICGAPNAEIGQKVSLALIGAKLADDIEIKKAKIRGVESFGMICSERELGISDDHSGIIVLDADARVGRPIVQHLDFDDYIMDFELTPDRADSMSAVGIARDIAALTSNAVKYPTYELKESSDRASDHISVSINDEEACPRFTARIIRNVKTGPSPWWIQKKLLTAGMRPISNIVDITNLVLLETGNPIHAFDLDRFGSDRVLVRRAKEGEQFTTLDGNQHKLTPEILLVTNGKEAKAAAGIMGGEDSEVSDRTRNILLEVAYFKPSVIRRGRKQMGLNTEASIRFEKGVDPNNVQHASARVAYLLQELCGGEILGGIVDCYPKTIEPCTVSFRPERCNKILGTDYSSDRMAEIFSNLEFTVIKSDPIKVTAPTFRHDICHEIDLIEEVARIEGYDSIPDAVENKGPLYIPSHKGVKFESELRQVLTASGFDEMVGHGLADSRSAEFLNPALPQLRIVNPVSEDLDIMRNSLIHSGLQVVSHNLAHRCLDLRLFEIGKVYFPPDKSGHWSEEQRLLILLSGKSRSSWRDTPRLLDFHDLVGAIERLGAHFHWPKFDYGACSIPCLDSGISYELTSGSQIVGSIGKVADDAAAKFDIKQQVYLAEFTISAIMKISIQQVIFAPLPIYPAAPRDLAIVVDVTTRVGDMRRRIAETAGELAETVDVFDLFMGNQIGQGKKSVGVAINYRSRDRSLEREEIDAIQQKVVEMLRLDFKAEIRERQ